MSYIFKEKVISGICFKQIFLCAEKIYNISLKYEPFGICFKKKFSVVNNYVIYL